MKNRYLMSALYVACICIYAIAINYIATRNINSTKQTEVNQPKIDESVYRVGEKVAPDTEVSPDKDDEKPQYMLIMEADRLCIYKLSEEKELVCDAPVSPLLMSEDDVEFLKNGIISENFEEIVLYYESYAS